jgi:hypothetical protein
LEGPQWLRMSRLSGEGISGTTAQLGNFGRQSVACAWR